MLGAYDFCGHYEWTFAWLEAEGGHALVREYWTALANLDLQEGIKRDGIAAMGKYWSHTLTEESPSLGFTITQKPGVFRIDMTDCPSKGFLLRNGLEQYCDYCDHCLGWVGPTMRGAGYVVDHEHNHRGQCWWEMRKPDPARGVAGVGETSGERDVRLRPDWKPPGAKLDRYAQATDPDKKLP